MMKLDTDFVSRCVRSLERAFHELQQNKKEDLLYDIYRAAVIKEFEIILEQAGKLLKKCLKPYFHSPKEVDRLTFNNIFREAGHHGLLELEQVENWIKYRNNRNSTAHDYGFRLAEKTLLLIPGFIEDAKSLIQVIERQNDS